MPFFSLCFNFLINWEGINTKRESLQFLIYSNEVNSKLKQFKFEIVQNLIYKIVVVYWLDFYSVLVK